MSASGEPSILQAAHAAVEASASHLRAWIETLENLPERMRRPPEEIALKRYRLDGLEKAERVLRSLLPFEAALREWLRERAKANT